MNKIEDLKTTLATRLTRNEHGISVKMCCASCRHMAYDNTGKRRCEKGYGLVEPNSVCEFAANYEMKKKLDAAGTYSGLKIKSKDYLAFVYQVLTNHWKEMDEVERRRKNGENIPFPRIPSVFQMRNEYEKLNKKSIYTK